LSLFEKLWRRKKTPPPRGDDALQAAPRAAMDEEDFLDTPPKKRRRFRIPLPSLPRFSGPAIGALVLVAAMAGLGAWLTLHGDETMSRRVVQTPRVLVPLDGRALEEEAPAVTPAAPPPVAAEAEPDKPPAGGPPPISLPGLAAVPAAPPAVPASVPVSPATPAAPRISKLGPPIQLKKAPEPGLVEQGPHGPLPIIAEDGRQAWRVYARPFEDVDKRPRIAIIVTDLGPSAAASEAAIQRLPGAVTLAFAPYGTRVPELVEQARAAGHETLMAMPSEPVDFPRNDPGPYTLLTALSTAENLDRLETVLSRVPGYVGVLTTSAGRFFTNEEALQPVLALLRRRGLLFVDGRGASRSVVQQLASAVGLPIAIGNRFLDAEASRGAIDARLAELEKLAMESGSATGIGRAYPVTIERIALWAETLADKGLALAPVTAVVERPK
jgi:polysaccharide deacetylase 2 family uncharacterized protein YibQ